MRYILKATAIMGSSSVVTILAGIAKNKLIALLLGPSGVGLLGLLNSLQTTVATFAGMGLSGSGIKEVAAADSAGNTERIALLRQVMFTASVFFGSIVAILLVLFRSSVVQFLLNDLVSGNAVVGIAVGVVAFAVARSQVAFLNGLHRINDLAKINIVGALLSLIVTVVAVWWLAEAGIVLAVVAVPFVNVFASYIFIRKIKLPYDSFSIGKMGSPLRKLLGLGIALMLTGLMTAGTQMLVKVLVTKELGLVSTGYFQASWSISMMYLGFVLAAMGTDYFPRLSGIIGDLPAASRMINEQTEVAVLLCSPVICAMIFFAPWVVKLLYSNEFAVMVPVLQWQLLGDFFKIGSWLLGFILLARGESRLFFCTELVWNSVYLAGVYFGLGCIGLKATGVAFLVAYIVYFILLIIVSYRLIHFVWNKRNIYLILAMGIAVSLTMLLTTISGLISGYLSLAVIVVVSVYSLIRIKKAINVHS